MWRRACSIKKSSVWLIVVLGVYSNDAIPMQQFTQVALMTLKKDRMGQMLGVRTPAHLPQLGTTCTSNIVYSTHW